MSSYEYKVIPAPPRGEKARGVKSAEARFAHALERLMNDMSTDGWEYQRAETLPSEERSGLTKTATVWRNLLVFRRMRADALEAFQPTKLEADPPQLAAPTPEPQHTAPTPPEPQAQSSDLPFIPAPQPGSQPPRAEPTLARLPDPAPDRDPQ